MSENGGPRIPEDPGPELSRREWLLRLGEGSALLGLSDIDLARAQAQAAALPPGVWLPSYDHLSHALSSREPFVPVPPGSQTEYRQPPSQPFEPRFFSPEEFKMVERLVQLMLGEPAGSAVVTEIAEWIDLSVTEAPAVRAAARALSPEHRALAVRFHGSAEVEELENTGSPKTCREGLLWFTRKNFLTLPESDQVALLSQVARDEDPESEDPGARFFHWLKQMVIRGFYTSRAGLDELDYKGNYFYTRSPGCDHPAR